MGGAGLDRRRPHDRDGRGDDGAPLHPRLGGGLHPGLPGLVDEVHAHGTKIIGQVTHAGHTSLTEPPPVLWAPTQMPEPSSHHTTRAMDLDDIARG